MAANLLTSLLSLGASLLPSIRASRLAPDNKRFAFEEDMERLIRTLVGIKATMYDAEEREIRDVSVKLWLKELKRVVYAAEDVLSEYRYEMTRVQVEAKRASESSGSHKRKQMIIVPISDGMVERLKKVRNQFDEIAKDREALQLRASDGATCSNNRNLQLPTGHMVDDTIFFGRGCFL